MQGSSSPPHYDQRYGHTSPAHHEQSPREWRQREHELEPRPPDHSPRRGYTVHVAPGETPFTYPALVPAGEPERREATARTTISTRNSRPDEHFDSEGDGILCRHCRLWRLKHRNSTRMKQHLASCKNAPESVKAEFRAGGPLAARTYRRRASDNDSGDEEREPKRHNGGGLRDSFQAEGFTLQPNEFTRIAELVRMLRIELKLYHVRYNSPMEVLNDVLGRFQSINNILRQRDEYISLHELRSIVTPGAMLDRPAMPPAEIGVMQAEATALPAVASLQPVTSIHSPVQYGSSSGRIESIGVPQRV